MSQELFSHGSTWGWELKTDTQFIFATHNPSFPVLGDAEMVVSCTDAAVLTIKTDRKPSIGARRYTVYGNL